MQVWADIDEGIAEFVRYLNTFPGVRTHYCCQGTLGEGGAEPYAPYVGVSWWDDSARAFLEKFNLTVEGECHGTVHPMPLPELTQSIPLSYAEHSGRASAYLPASAVDAGACSSTFKVCP